MQHKNVAYLEMRPVGASHVKNEPTCAQTSSYRKQFLTRPNENVRSEERLVSRTAYEGHVLHAYILYCIHPLSYILSITRIINMNKKRATRSKCISPESLEKQLGPG
jgi:hypothetical protein